MENNMVQNGIQREKAVVVLSGGLDSATCMGIAHHYGYEIHALTFDYGQRHRIELKRAKKLAQYYGATHKIIKTDFLKMLGKSSLTDFSMEVPTDRDVENEKDIPNTYVPFRNGIFLSMAIAYAEAIGAKAIFTGVNAVDYSGYTDCRPEFIDALQQVIDKGTVAGAHGDGIKLMTPLIHMSKAEIIELGTELGVPYKYTHSCYQGTSPACGVCDSCKLRIKGFMEAGVKDPIRYAIKIDWPRKRKKGE